MKAELYIKNAKIVTSDKVVSGDLLIENGKITDFGDIRNSNRIPEIDAQYNHVIPGGIDAHVHFSLNTAKGITTDDFESGSKAALAGGNTTIIDFITPLKTQSLEEAYKDRLLNVDKIHTDYSFHQSIVSWNEDTPIQMEKAVNEQGITSFKTYLAYKKIIGIDLITLEKVMQKAKELNAVVLVHAEEGDLIDSLEEEYKDSDLHPAIIHQKTHPDKSEEQAIEDVISITRKTSCKTYIVHVSTKKGMELIHEAKEEDLPIFAETCPQYFCFSDNTYSTPKESAIDAILSPPLKSIENRVGIIQAISKGYVDCLSTDHCAFDKKTKYNYSKNYFSIPHGIGGVQYRLLLSHTHFIRSSRLTWIDYAKLTSENPAKIFGLAHKGKIEIGYDADLVIIQGLEKKDRINNIKGFSKSDINVFENQAIYSKINTVIKNGQVVFENDDLSSDIPLGNKINRQA